MRKTAAVLVLTLAAAVSCIAPPKGPVPKAAKGILDLSGWEEARHGPLKLNGEWEFYWMKLIGPEGFSGKVPPQKTGYISLPGPWNNYVKDGHHPDKYGYATFRMVMEVPPGERGAVRSIRMPFVHSAYRLWINGKPACSNGTVGTSERDMRAFQLPVIASFYVDSPRTEFILQISNYQQRMGGILKSIAYGTPGQIAAMHDKNLFIVMFAAGCIFIIILYHVGLYLLNRAYAPSLLFAAFALIIVLRLLLTEEKLLVRVFPGIPWVLFFKAEYLTITGGILSFMFFVYLLYREEMSRVMVWGITGYHAAFTVFIFAAPASILSGSLVWFHLGLLIAGSYLMFIILYAAVKKGKGTAIYIIGMAAIFIAMLNDIVYSQQLIHSIYLMPLGLLIFLFTQSFVTIELSVETQRRMISINNELDISRRIQRLILPPSVPSIEGVDIQVRYLTMDAIGGDFYHFHVIDGKRFGVIVSDVTGHGIPASLIASTVNIAFSLQKDFAADPPALLSNMNSILRGQTGGQHVTAVYAYLDLEGRRLRSARAGHPLPIVLKKKENTAMQLDSRGRLLGIFEDNTITGAETGVEPGDKIILYTDGLFEQRNTSGEIWGDERLMDFISDNRFLTARELADALIVQLRRWLGKDRNKERNMEDDLTLVVMEILQPGPRS